MDDVDPGGVACFTLSIGHVQIVHSLSSEENAEKVIDDLQNADHHNNDHVYFVVVATPTCNHCNPKTKEK